MDEQPMAQISKQTKGLISQLHQGYIARGPSHTTQCMQICAWHEILSDGASPSGQGLPHSLPKQQGPAR